MNRRDLLMLFAGAAAAAPIGANAQQPGGKKRIGILNSVASNDPSRHEALLEALKRLGWTDGGNAQIDVRWAEGNSSNFVKYAAELIDLAPDVIVAWSPPAVFALQDRTRSVPIVFIAVGDPVGYGIIPSMSQPGGNITGVANFGFAMGGKWIELLKEIAPSVSRVGFFYHPSTTTKGYDAYLKSVVSAAPSFSMGVQELLVRDAAEIQALMNDFARQPNSGLILPPDPFTSVHRAEIADVAQRLRLPAIYPFSVFVESGGLVSYGVDQLAQVQKVATFVNRILRGEHPRDLPAEGPTKFESAINARTAKAMNLVVPPTLLARADVVVE